MSPRQKTFVRHSPKPKLIFDEGFPFRTSFKNLNNYFNVKHIKQDFKLSGIADEEVYKIASDEGGVLVTFNVKDFKPLLISNSPSVIGVSPALSNDEIDKKLTARVKRFRPADLKGKFFKVN